MTSKVEAKLITGDELAEMGDIGRCELVEGEIIRCRCTTRSQTSRLSARGICWTAATCCRGLAWR